MHTVLLSCTHTRRYKYHPPEPGDVLWCPRCADFKPVTALVGPYRASCHNCPRLDIAGRSEEIVARKACEHAEHYNHTVSLWVSGDAKSRTIVTGDTRGQLLLPTHSQESRLSIRPGAQGDRT